MNKLDFPSRREKRGAGGTGIRLTCFRAFSTSTVVFLSLPMFSSGGGFLFSGTCPPGQTCQDCENEVVEA